MRIAKLISYIALVIFLPIWLYFYTKHDLDSPDKPQEINVNLKGLAAPSQSPVIVLSDTTKKTAPVYVNVDTRELHTAIANQNLINERLLTLLADRNNRSAVNIPSDITLRIVQPDTQTKTQTIITSKFYDLYENTDQQPWNVLVPRESKAITSFRDSLVLFNRSTRYFVVIDTVVQENQADSLQMFQTLRNLKAENVAIQPNGNLRIYLDGNFSRLTKARQNQNQLFPFIVFIYGRRQEVRKRLLSRDTVTISDFRIPVIFH